MKKRGTPRAITTLVGTVIGAGILGIPYIMATSGYLTGLAVTVILGLMILFMNLFAGEVVLRTKSIHQLPGYAEIYLGKTGKFFMMLAFFIGIYGALLAYLIGVGISLFAIFKIWNATSFSLIYYAAVAIIVYLGLKVIEEFELSLVSMMSVIVILISALCIFSPQFSVSNLTVFDASKLFLPFGVILFAYMGAASIPEMHEELIKEKKNLKKAIIWGSLIPMFIYILFPLAIVGVLGTTTTQVATVGIGELFGEWMIIFANVFAIFAMTTSLLTLGQALKEMYIFDYKLKEISAWALTMFVPLIIFFLGLKSFVKVLGFAGSIAGGIEGIVVVLMLWAAKKHGKRKPEYSLHYTRPIGMILIVVFVLGIVYQILSNLGFI